MLRGTKFTELLGERRVISRSTFAIVSASANVSVCVHLFSGE